MRSPTHVEDVARGAVAAGEEDQVDTRAGASCGRRRAGVGGGRDSRFGDRLRAAALVSNAMRWRRCPRPSRRARRRCSRSDDAALEPRERPLGSLGGGGNGSERACPLERERRRRFPSGRRGRPRPAIGLTISPRRAIGSGLAPQLGRDLVDRLPRDPDELADLVLGDHERRRERDRVGSRQRAGDQAQLEAASRDPRADLAATGRTASPGSLPATNSSAPISAVPRTSPTSGWSSNASWRRRLHQRAALRRPGERGLRSRSGRGSPSRPRRASGCAE